MRLPAASLLGLLALGACATDDVAARGPEPITPTERYAIDVRPAPEELKLAARPGGLSPAQEEALEDFVRQWMLAEGGDVTLKTPEHGPDPAGAYRTATSARDFLIAHGMTSARVRIVGYEAQGDVHAPILVGYMRYQAKGPDCGRSWEDVAKDDSNEAYASFGCAVTANIAAQIATPADLLAPRAGDAADAERRQAVIDKYRQGTTTSTAKDTQANGTFSTVGGQ